jgi:hypothetical protein
MKLLHLYSSLFFSNLCKTFASFLPGPAVSEVRGQLGGIVFSRNTHGPYMRTNFTPVNPNTTLQQAVRANFQSASSRWKNDLTVAQRLDWETYAANTPVTNKFGSTGYLTGFQQFVGHQAFASLIGLGNISDAPLGYGAATMPQIVPAQITCHYDTEKLNITAAGVISNYTADDTDENTAVFMGQPISAGRSYFNGPYRHITTLDDATVYPLALDTLWTVPVAGAIVPVKFKHYDPQGRLSSSSAVFITPTASV